MPTGSFEAERSQQGPPAEEPQDFDLLLAEIRGASREDAQARMAEWVDRFQHAWTNGSEQWANLVDLLPRDREIEPSVAHFRKQLLSATRPPSAADLFFAHPSIVPKLSSYAWTDFLGPTAAGFVAGCLNVARAAAQSGSPSSTTMGTLSNAVANYYLTLIGVALHDPDLVIPTEDGCSLADALDVPRERFERWSFEKSEDDLRRLLTTFEAERVLDVIRSLLGQKELPEAVLLPLLKLALGAGEEPWAAALIDACAFESAELSGVLKDRYSRQSGEERSVTLSLWARYVTLADAFALCWECVKPGTPESPAPLGETIDERLKRFEKLLRIPTTVGDQSRRQWREPALRAMAAIGSLAARKWAGRDDQLVCEDDAIAALKACPAILSPTISGILDHAHPYWDVLDPVLLRLPPDQSVPVLAEYADRASVWQEARHHAARLLTRAKGEAVLGQNGEGGPAAAEHLPEPARERRPMASQTWLAEGALERLWHVALEVAQTRFDESMATRYAEEKDEHCAALADSLARALNGTNAALKMWLRWNGAPPPVIHASVRRLPSKTKRTGAGLQADLAFLIRCNIAGKCLTKRITPMRAKKLAAPGSQPGWPGDFRVQGSERTHLTRLLTLSAATHYLFILPRELGESLRVLPGALVRDILAAQGFAGGVPVQTVLQAGMRLPEFVLFHVLGLWTGDDDPDLIAKAESETDADRPHVVLDVSVSKPA